MVVSTKGPGPSLQRSKAEDLSSIEALTRDLLPKLIKDRPTEASVRLWVPGCSTGQEVYTLAICLLELLGDTTPHPPVQIFGTDVSEAAVAKARAGIYPEKIADDVSPERLARFFVRRDGKLQVSKEVRALCVFARHDLIQDPPFSRLDLISCRNVLIYLKPEAQKRVIASFHYALKPTGYLILGQSESPAAVLDRFRTVDREHKIYAPEECGSRFSSLSAPAARPREAARFGVPAGWAAQEAATRAVLQKGADRLLLDRYSPPGVLIDESLEILQFRGDTQPYLKPAQGQASLSLLRMAKKGLLAGLRRAVQEAKAACIPVRKPGLKLLEGQDLRSVDIEVVPIQLPWTQQRCFLVLFENTAAAGSRRRETQPGSAPSDNALSEELAATREYLQGLVDDQADSIRELQTAHEEALSANEELQSLNEELETAKEELQSSNDELTRLNEELRQSNLELLRLSDDRVARELDQGATFTVAFPASPLLVRSLETEAVEAPTVEDGPALHGLRLLVVDNEDSSRKMLAELLERLGAEVIAAASAAEAFSALEDRVPDVLISDIGMPGESGYDLLRKVRALPPARGGLVPAIAFTAYCAEQDRLEALAAGFQMHHTKPADPARLVAAIAMLGRRPAVL